MNQKDQESREEGSKRRSSRSNQEGKRWSQKWRSQEEGGRRPKRRSQVGERCQ